MPKASLILRFTNRSKIRADNLVSVARQASWNPDLEIIISVMEKDIDLSCLKFNGLPGRATLVHNFSPGPFSSSRANNVGASLASSNILIFQDADILFDPKAYKEIIRLIEGGEKAVRAGEWCQNINRQNTVRIFKNHSLSASHGFMNVHRQLKLAESTTSCRRDAPGACHAISKQAFIDVGGYSEEFKVYGWEDCYFRYKMQKLKRKSLGFPMLHLDHEINYQMAKQPDNAELYYRIVYADPKKYEAILEKDKKELLEKYPKFQ